MSILFKQNWQAIPPVFQNDPVKTDRERSIIRELDNTENHIRAILFEAWHAGGFTNGVINGMLLAANSDGGAQVTIRQGLHQVSHPDEANDGAGGYSLHIGTGFNGVNFHLNVLQTNGGRVYVTSISHGAAAIREVRPNPPPG